MKKKKKKEYFADSSKRHQTADLIRSDTLYCNHEMAGAKNQLFLLNETIFRHSHMFDSPRVNTLAVSF